MEGIWGVADVDADEELEDADEGADKDEDVDMDSSSQSSHASEFEVGGGVPRIGSAAPETTSSMVRTNSWRRLDTSRNRRCRRGWCTSATAGRSIAGAVVIALTVCASSAGTGTATGRGGASG